MKYTIKNKIRNIVILMFIAVFIQALMIIATIQSLTTDRFITSYDNLADDTYIIDSDSLAKDDVFTLKNFQNAKIDIQIILFISVIIQFIFIVVTFIYSPIYLKNSLTNLSKAIKDLSKGDFNADLSKYLEHNDKEISEILTSLEQLREIFLQFDSLKEAKIFEHNKRIKALLSLSSEQGFIIINDKGDIRYVNETVLDTFPNLQEGTNLIYNTFAPEVENSIKKQATQIVRYKSKPDELKYFIPAQKRHITIDCKIIRDANNIFKGAVLSINNLDKKKAEKGKDTKQNE